MNKIDKQVVKQKILDKVKEKKKMNTPNFIAPQNLITLISEYFNKNNIRYWLSEDHKNFRVGYDFTGEGKFEIFINVEEHYLLFNCAVLEDVKDEAVANTLDIIARINQFYNLGFLNFYFESRVVGFKISYLLFENELTENKFKTYFECTIDGARSCRPLITKVAVEGEEPIIAMMSMINNG
jgi:hypothetical protein